MKFAEWRSMAARRIGRNGGSQAALFASRAAPYVEARARLASPVRE